MVEQVRKVAVLGTGTIGAPIARNIRGRFAVNAWNRTRSRADALAADGVEVFDDPAAAVEGADVVVTVLKDGPAVLEAMEAAAPGLAEGAVWVQISTVGAEAVGGLAEFAEGHGLVFYDAPVLGTKQPAEKGLLTVLAAGPEGAGRAAADAVFGAIGARTVWVGEAPGAASRLKLALNSYVFALTHGTAEALSLARALGVDPALVVDAVKGGPLDSGYFQGKAAAILAEEYEPSFTVDNAAKDARLVVEAARAADVSLDLAEAGLRRFERAAERGHGGKDMAATYLAE